MKKQKFVRIMRVTIFTLSCVVFLGALYMWMYVDLAQREYYLRIDVLDVGQGDAILITTPSGRQILIDGGRDSQVLYELARSMKWWDRHIDVVIATHPDADHIGGLIEVLNRYRIDHVVDYGFYDDEDLDQVYNRSADRQPDHSVRSTVSIDMGDGVFIDSYSIIDADDPGSTPNERSHISILRYGQISMLLTGDAGIDTEKKFLDEGLLSLSSTRFLKVGHHGSKTSSGDELLSYFMPNLSLISAGADNRYGHPSQEVINRFDEYGLPTLCTCEVGRISIITDGRSWRVETDQDFEIDGMNIFPRE